jgi:hypothetical protein
MLVQYVGDEKSVVIGNVAVFPQGEPVEVDDALGASLIEQPAFAETKPVSAKSE